MRHLWAVAPLAILLLPGCFNPDLGDQPFQCATSGKLCPDGYQCNTVGGFQVCVKEDKGSDAGPVTDTKILTDAELMPSKERPFFLDGRPVKNPSNCLDSANENPPNNSIATATNLDAAGSGTIPGWEICYPGDVDVYAITRSIGQKLVVKVKFFHNQGDLEAAMFDPSGMLIDQSRSEDDDEEVQMNTATEDGKHFVAVWGFKDDVNTYDLVITKD